jgi:hypothetical protein
MPKKIIFRKLWSMTDGLIAGEGVRHCIGLGAKPIIDHYEGGLANALHNRSALVAN